MTILSSFFWGFLFLLSCGSLPRTSELSELEEELQQPDIALRRSGFVVSEQGGEVTITPVPFPGGSTT
jgi:hypothetical protein